MHWKHIAPIIHEPQNHAEYEKLADMLDQLLDIVGNNESHELIGLVDVISHMISMYDECHQKPLQQDSGVDALKFLMEQHSLGQSDLKNEIGSQGVVFEILNGKRQLNLSHIKKLVLRFAVKPATLHMTKNLEMIYVAQPSSKEIQSLYDGIATHAQLKKNQLPIESFGFFDEKTCKLEPLPNPFWPKVLPMSPV